MSKTTASPPFPDSPGAWIACFRHRARVNGHAPSPEELGRLIDRSGATIRRWERNSHLPDERDIERLAAVCDLSPHHVAFLSVACSRMRAMPAPDRGDFVRYMEEWLGSTYPALVIDGLFYVRAWNSYLDALEPGMAESLRRDLHPLALVMRVAARQGVDPVEDEGVRNAVRLFWMGTAPHAHRPEYRRTLAALAQEPGFTAVWMDLALGEYRDPTPIGFRGMAAAGSASFDIYSRTLSFPPAYVINEYHPASPLARERLEAMRVQAPRVFFKRRLHWVQAHCECGCE